MAKNSFRVKRDKTAPLVFNYEIELTPDPDSDGADDGRPDEIDVDPQTPDQAAQKAIDEAASLNGDGKPKPTSFTVGDRTYPFEEVFEEDGGEIKRHWFRARPKVPGALILDLVGSSVHVNSGYSAAALREFLDTSVDKRDRGRFEKMLTDPDNPIDIQDLNSVVEFLTSQYSDRPTARPARS